MHANKVTELVGEIVDSKDLARGEVKIVRHRVVHGAIENNPISNREDASVYVEIPPPPSKEPVENDDAKEQKEFWRIFGDTKIFGLVKPEDFVGNKMTLHPNEGTDGVLNLNDFNVYEAYNTTELVQMKVNGEIFTLSHRSMAETGKYSGTKTFMDLFKELQPPEFATQNMFPDDEVTSNWVHVYMVVHSVNAVDTQIPAFTEKCPGFIVYNGSRWYGEGEPTSKPPVPRGILESFDTTEGLPEHTFVTHQTPISAERAKQVIESEEGIVLVPKQFSDCVADFVYCAYSPQRHLRQNVRDNRSSLPNTMWANIGTGILAFYNDHPGQHSAFGTPKWKNVSQKLSDAHEEFETYFPRIFSPMVKLMERVENGKFTTTLIPNEYPFNEKSSMNDYIENAAARTIVSACSIAAQKELVNVYKEFLEDRKKIVAWFIKVAEDTTCDLKKTSNALKMKCLHEIVVEARSLCYEKEKSGQKKVTKGEGKLKKTFMTKVPQKIHDENMRRIMERLINQEIKDNMYAVRRILKAKGEI